MKKKQVRILYTLSIVLAGGIVSFATKNTDGVIFPIITYQNYPNKTSPNPQKSPTTTSPNPQNPNNSDFFDDDFFQNIIIRVVSPLIVSGLIAFFTWLWTKQQFKKKIDAAPREYIKELDSLISRAEKEGKNNAIVNGRAIVTARNSLRQSLVSISRNLNSEIDRLAGEIGQPGETEEFFEELGRRTEENNRNTEEIYETIQVLHRVWPSKKREIEVEIRKLLAELDLSIDSAR